ncbi:thioredoxin-like fold domain-containing protein MRL7, chloroplastic [Salvia splendens]|uniref:thioredoxin-like fold domain-containing protein MRL7, chloroplastic n=1 Tax=Salvia splendens TaxID=180675 RepID=UPI001C253612|nr:thioredoxin-like fold domain-containing protein MRL7, chloroplastic [Salvia splendens]XP_042006297.1 thioredoxin-like fold domain-containing protein MRL7, chloroplastic [Salvia splendens]XP_042006298.1 thioredoxin-like fold domain-containing protein MRL7, chloroplastic [Salvia splendens]XP_042006299.1 thioredoxin-like fold domain-containing protein MRL7, chloroplastic [Salvia splendens]
MAFSTVNHQALISALNITSSLSPSTRAKISTPVSCSRFPSQALKHIVKRFSYNAASSSSDQNPKSERRRKKAPQTSKERKSGGENPEGSYPGIIPKKPRRGRRSEAAAVEDYIRGSLKHTLESIRKQNPEVLENMENFMKEKAASDDDSSDDEDVVDVGEKDMVVEEEDPDWPLDTEVGWGIRASEYFDQHSIKNVVGEDGTEIDWEGEIDYGLVKEINCLEWESFAFHPSPLIVLFFERYKRASDNWKVLKELEKAAEVYWKAKDRLPPRTVKVDINIEKDLAYALKAEECPQLLFLRGNKILHREKEFRSADELVQIIAYFYYNAKRPSCINDEALSSPR